MDDFRWPAMASARSSCPGHEPDDPTANDHRRSHRRLCGARLRLPDQSIRRTVELAGDEVTIVEAAAIFAERLGRPVTYTPEHEDRPGGGGEARKMAAWFDDHGYEADIAALRAIYPSLADLRAFVARAEWLMA